MRQHLVEEGLEAALSRKLQENRNPRRLEGEMIALACSTPPTGLECQFLMSVDRKLF